MSWFRKPKVTGFDRELLRRLDALAFANAKVRRGEIAANELNLVPNVNAEGIVEANRPAVPFQLQPIDRRGDVWSFVGSIAEPAATLRFLLDLHVEAGENLPGLEATFRRHPDFEHGELARSYCAMLWRADVDAGFLAERSAAPLLSGTVVLGARLTRTPVTYASPESGSWYLLKCDQPGPFFVGFDAETGAAEMFPRRYDVEGYAFAMELLRVVA